MPRNCVRGPCTIKKKQSQTAFYVFKNTGSTFKLAGGLFLVVKTQSPCLTSLYPGLDSVMPPSTLSSHSWPGTGYVQYSSRTFWHGRRNVHAVFLDTASLKYTYQEMNNVEVKSHEELKGEVVADGKDGKLESWMKETEMGIEDPSGKLIACPF
jgi:hypothetical protein